MRTRAFLSFSACGFLVFSPSPEAAAQHAFAHTVTVDLSGNADKTTIQEGITECESLGAPCTVLIYSGEYEIANADDPVVLDTAQIDLIGVDRESVIIDVTASGMNAKSGIKIEGASTPRNNRIANINIKTAEGHGIEIVDDGSGNPAEGLTIENVTIAAAGSGMDGINAGEGTEDLTVRNCTITSAANHGIKAVEPVELVISDSAIRGASAGHGVFLDAEGAEGNPTGITIRRCDIRAVSGAGVEAQRTVNVAIADCELFSSNSHGFNATIASSEGIQITRCVIHGKTRGVFLTGTTEKDVVISESTLTATAIENRDAWALEISQVLTGASVRVVDSVLRGTASGTGTANGMRHDADAGGLVSVERCLLEAVNTSTGKARAVWVDGGPTVYADCQLVARNTNEGPAGGGPTYGVDVASGMSLIVIIGGSIQSASLDKNNEQVCDVFVNPMVNPESFAVSRCSLSKWRGEIHAAEGRRVQAQRMVGIAALDADGLLNDQSFGTPVTVDETLGHYRTLQLTWNDAPTDGEVTVTVIGENWARDRIVEDFTLTEINPIVDGSKPFIYVDEVILPSASGSLDMGWNDRLGLYSPLGGDADFLQWAKLVSSEYEVQPAEETEIDAVFATVDVGTITAGDGIEFAYLTP